MNLDGKVVLVTGAGKGLGRRLVRYFADRGCRVAANDISPINLDQFAAESGGIRTYPEDMAKKVGVQAVLKQVEDDFGQLDILVNHAAVQPRSGIVEMDEWDWRRVLDVNLGSAFLATQSAGRMMRPNRSGLIVNCIDLADEGKGRAAYAASMLALWAFTRVASAEFEPHGIVVHALGRLQSSWMPLQPSIPLPFDEAMLHLLGASETGQFINLEAS